MFHEFSLLKNASGLVNVISNLLNRNRDSGKARSRLQGVRKRKGGLFKIGNVGTPRFSSIMQPSRSGSEINSKRNGKSSCLNRFATGKDNSFEYHCESGTNCRNGKKYCDSARRPVDNSRGFSLSRSRSLNDVLGSQINDQNSSHVMPTAEIILRHCVNFYGIARNSLLYVSKVWISEASIYSKTQQSCGCVKRTIIDPELEDSVATVDLPLSTLRHQSFHNNGIYYLLCATQECTISKWRRGG